MSNGAHGKLQKPQLWQSKWQLISLVYAWCFVLQSSENGNLYSFKELKHFSTHENQTKLKKSTSLTESGAYPQLFTQPNLKVSFSHHDNTYIKTNKNLKFKVKKAAFWHDEKRDF